jgi:hypothetical protein
MAAAPGSFRAIRGQGKVFGMASKVELYWKPG